MAKPMSVGVKVALIAASAGVLAAIITGGISIFQKSSPTTQQSTSLVASKIENSGDIGNADKINIDRSIKFAQTNSGLIQGQINSPVQPLNLTQIFNNYNSSNPPDSGLKEWVTNLDLRTSTNTAEIHLTRNEIVNLTLLLAKLDERTSGIEKLPDGRTRLGAIVGGAPYVVADAISNAVRSLLHGDNSSALKLAQMGIDAFNGSKRTNIFSEETVITPYGKGVLYAVAAQSAQRLESNSLANDFALKAVEADSTDINKMILVTTLCNLGMEERKRNMFSNALSFYQQAITNYEGVKTEATNFVSGTQKLGMYGTAIITAFQLGNSNLVSEYSPKIIALASEMNLLQKPNTAK